MTAAASHHIGRCRRELRQAQDNIAWLSEPNPAWSCGTPVPQSAREQLLQMNRDAVEYYTSYLSRKISDQIVDDPTPQKHDHMSKHTQKPWALVGPRGIGFYRNYGIRHESPGHIGGEFATVHTLHNTPEAHAMQDANAQLLIAAPELLEACQLLLTLSLPSDVSGMAMVEKARRAVAKATGRE